MIKSFKHKGLKSFFTTGSTAGINPKHASRIEERLQALHTAMSIEDMDIQPHNPMHPGAFIKRVYLEPNDISSNELARKLKVTPGLISRLINGKTNVSPAMALKLSVVLGRSPESWLLMQDNYDLWKARKEIDLNNYNTIEFAV